MRYPPRRCCAIAASLAWAPSTMAHGTGHLGAFYDGAADLVLHWDITLLLLVAGLWCGQQSGFVPLKLGGSIIAALVVGMTATIFSRMSPGEPFLWSGAACLSLGVAVALQLRGDHLWIPVFGSFSGFIGGVSIAAQAMEGLTRPWLFAAGASAGAGVLLFYITHAVRRVPNGWPEIGVRVAGSWIAAIGLMLGAFALAPRI